MTVRLNEFAIRQLLEAENGPVGRDLARRAENIRVQALTNADNNIIGILTSRLYEGVFARIDTDEDGLLAVIGTDATDSKGFSYPAWHDQHGRPWLTSALEAGRD